MEAPAALCVCGNTLCPHKDCDASAPASSSSSGGGTSSLSRGIQHLDWMRWMQAIGLSALIRTAVQHPFNVATARKRVHRDFISLREVFIQTYASGVASGTRFGGWRSLYRGFGVCVVGNVAGECLYLSVLEHMRHHFPSGSEAARDAVGGACGDLASLVLCTPLSVITNRQMTAGFGMATGNTYAPAVSIFRQLATSPQGWRASLYSGFTASLYVVPTGALWWSSYGLLKRSLYTVAAPFTDPSVPAGLRSSTDNPLLNGGAGVIASLLTTTVANPFNVVRTRMQVLDDTSLGKAATRPWQVHRWRAVRVGRDLVAAEGYRAFFKGLPVNATVAAFDGLMFSTIYEFTKWVSDRTLT